MTFETAVQLASAMGFDPCAWAAAKMDDGIFFVGPTRKKCVEALGICTPYKRSRVGRAQSVYCYTSESGTVGYVGAFASLLVEGFEAKLFPERR